MSRPSITPQLGCENDIEGRFTAEPGWDSQRDVSVSDCAEVICALASRQAGAGRAARPVTGVSMDPCEKAGRPMPEASGNIMSFGTAEPFSPRSGSGRWREPRVVLCPRCDRGARDANIMRQGGVHAGLVSGCRLRFVGSHILPIRVSVTGARFPSDADDACRSFLGADRLPASPPSQGVRTASQSWSVMPSCGAPTTESSGLSPRTKKFRPSRHLPARCRVGRRHPAGLASVRRSNGLYGFPVSRFHKGVSARVQGRNQ